MIRKLAAWCASIRGLGLLGCLGIGLVLLWSYWPVLGLMARRWSADPQYSHGYLVPLFALVLLWMRRGQLSAFTSGFSWWGVPLILAGVGLRLAAVYFYLPWPESVSLLPCLLGLFVLAGGVPALKWAWPAVAFLLFMIPLPYRIGAALAPSLQRFATLASTYTLETIGLPAFAEGNVILLNDARIGVSEACSGLSMLIIFFALSTAVAVLIKRALWEKLVVVFSAVPIAIVANVARITITGILHEHFGGAVAETFHDQAAWLMMPLALALLGIELKLLSRLFVLKQAPPRAPLPVRRSPAPQAAAAAERGRKRQRSGRAKPAVSPVKKG